MKILSKIPDKRGRNVYVVDLEDGRTAILTVRTYGGRPLVDTASVTGPTMATHADRRACLDEAQVWLLARIREGTAEVASAGR